MIQANAEGFVDVASPFSYVERARLAEAAPKYRLPMFWYKENVAAGGLVSYGADIKDLYWRATAYIDKILKGANPADRPVERASNELS